MIGPATPHIRSGSAQAAPPSSMTLVELTWVERKIERWIRFGQPTYEQILDRRRRIVGFPRDSIFAFLRWASNGFGTIISRIDIVRAVGTGEPFQTLSFVRPGGDILLKIEGWPRVERALQAIDAIEALSIDPAEVSPEYWRHVHNRLTAGEPARPYTIAQHKAFLLRRRALP